MSYDGKRLEHLWLAAVAGTVFLLCAPGAAQVRGGLSIGGPSSVGSQGNFGAGQFRTYSYGLGNLGGAASASGGGVLQSSIAGFASDAGFRRDSSSGGGHAAPTGLGAGESRVLYRPPTVDLDVSQSARVGRTGLLSPSEQMTGGAWMGALGIASADLTAAAEPITSFVPDTPGPYAKLMRAGEQAMRTGQLQPAIDRFDLTLGMDPRVPESLLSLANAHLAMGNYAQAAHYLSEAVKYLPELPLARIHLRAFFRSPAEFVKCRKTLREQAARTGVEPDLWFCLAYIEWFDSETPQAAASLAKAAQSSMDPALTEAVEAFWDGCVASGKVAGQLGAAVLTSQPATRPAADLAKPAGPSSQALTGSQPELAAVGP